MFYRKNEDGNAVILNDDGTACTKIDVDGIYPVDSQFSTRYEHVNGIILTISDAKKLGLQEDVE